MAFCGRGAASRGSTWLLAVVGALACTRLGYDPLELAPGLDAGGSSGAGGALGGAPGGAGGGNLGGAGSTAAGSAGTAGAGPSGGSSGGGPAPLPGAPVAEFQVSPPVGTEGTIFTFDARDSADAQDPIDSLTFDWDWDSDGAYDAGGVTGSHSFGAPGDYVVTLRVTDTDGNAAFHSLPLVVVAAADFLLVTTGVDEIDNGATADAPGGTGLSLREAITIANGRAGKQVITFQSGVTVGIDYGLPVISDDADVVGDSTLIDGSALGGNGPCVRTQAVVRLHDLEISGCPGAPIAIQGGSDSVVSGCYVHDNGSAVQILTGSNHVFGPGNEVTRSTDRGVYANSPGVRIVRNFIHDNPTEGVLAGGGADDLRVIGNLLVSATINLQIAGDDASVWHNTFVGAAESAVVVNNAAGLDLRNNIVFGAGQYGLDASDAELALQDFNLFFGNGAGACSSCTLGPGSVELDPSFVDAAGGDYRLSSGSPAVDVGADLGIDVDDSLPGNFSGAAPDLGCFELPQ